MAMTKEKLVRKGYCNLARKTKEGQVFTFYKTAPIWNAETCPPSPVTSKEVANLVAFLIDTQNTGITGQIYEIK